MQSCRAATNDVQNAKSLFIEKEPIYRELKPCSFSGVASDAVARTTATRMLTTAHLTTSSSSPFHSDSCFTLALSPYFCVETATSRGLPFRQREGDPPNTPPPRGGQCSTQRTTVWNQCDSQQKCPRRTVPPSIVRLSTFHTSKQSAVMCYPLRPHHEYPRHTFPPSV
jgi:hypothetical protein